MTSSLECSVTWCVRGVWCGVCGVCVFPVVAFPEMFPEFFFGLGFCRGVPPLWLWVGGQ